MAKSQIQNRAARALLAKIDTLAAHPAGPFGNETPQDLAALSTCYKEDRAELALVLPKVVAAIAASPAQVTYSGQPAIPTNEVGWAKDLGKSLLGRSQHCQVLTGFAHFASFDALVHALPAIRAEVKGK
jgi:hypothetical protein